MLTTCYIVSVILVESMKLIQCLFSTTHQNNNNDNNDSRTNNNNYDNDYFIYIYIHTEVIICVAPAKVARGHYLLWHFIIPDLWDYVEIYYYLKIGY